MVRVEAKNEVQKRENMFFPNFFLVEGFKEKRLSLEKIEKFYE